MVVNAAEPKPAPAFSYELEKQYYSRDWPSEAKPYLHLEPYLRCWMKPDPGTIFGGKRVLDIGAGECTYTRLIAERFAPARIVACELFRERMMPAQRANTAANLGFVAGSCFELPFRSGSFDVVFGTFVLHQIPDLAALVREIRRVLAPGGRYVGIEPNPWNAVHLYRFWRGAHSRNQYLFGPRHLRFFRDAGFARASARFFYVRLPRWAHNCLTGTCVGIGAVRD